MTIPAQIVLFGEEPAPRWPQHRRWLCRDAVGTRAKASFGGGGMSGLTFERVVAGAICRDAGLLISGLSVDGHQQLFEALHDGFVGFFAIELGGRLRRAGWRFFNGRWNAAVIVAARRCHM
jgi:hypothetical protein